MRPHQRALIGREAQVTASSNKQLVGIKGIVEDETKNTITIGGKKLPKSEITITIEGNTIEGKDISKTLTERIKVHKQ